MNVILCGACGRMGANVASLAPDFGATVVCGVDAYPAPRPFPVYASFAEATERADAVIDFSSPDRLEERLAFCKERKIGIVLASTGLSDADLRLVEEYSAHVAVFRTGNLSVGINLLQMLAKKAAEVLGDAFDVEIVEKHHNKKKDAPSGTALMLAESVNEGFSDHKELVFGRHGMVGERQKSEIGIHAVRGGTIVGEHEVLFAGEDEIVTLAHSARSRKVFAAGALRAASWLIGKPAGKYDMSDMLQSVFG
ncbi:MAG: 4-hydroxy-tetrahydrodipicolinate reductase [Candidatus Gallimonas sp.]